jgi:uncharacterized protein (TIGR02246 family)
MSTDSTERQNFIPYPTNRVVGTVSDASSAEAAITSLLHAGFDEASIDVLHGEGGVQRLDPGGTRHGFLAQFQRTLLRAAAQTEEYKHLIHHVDDVKAGRFVIMVLAPRREQREVAADILNAHGAEFVGFYGRWAWKGLAPVESNDRGPATGLDRDRHAFAKQPDQIPALFADAWNRRDADALSSLFTEDAEFVNVTGLWWHDRVSIRKAHAYGLERIFNESTLTIEEVRLKQLSDDVVVVHARMALRGQTPVADISRPGLRTNIFSFVMRLVGDAWLCASAHNTDVQSHMETNVVDDAGRLRGANYRTGERS